MEASQQISMYLYDPAEIDARQQLNQYHQTMMASGCGRDVTVFLK